MAAVIPLNRSKPFLKLQIPSRHQARILNSINYGVRIGNRGLNLHISVNGTARPRTQKQWRRGSIVSELDTDPHEDDKKDGEGESLGVKAALSMLTFYKREISPLLPKSCRYVPSCSEYSMIAYRKYGFVQGTVLTAWRLCRCNPLGGSGFDPPRWFDEEAPSEE